jgi:hypothetical protein
MIRNPLENRTLRPTLAFFASILILVIPTTTVAQNQCWNGQCSASAWGYYPAVPYYVAPRAYATPPAPFRQYGGSGRIYETAGDPAQLTAWIAINDPARASVAVPVPVATPVTVPTPQPTPVPTPKPPDEGDRVCGTVTTHPPARIKVKIHHGRYELGCIMQMLKDYGLMNADATYEPGYPIYGEVEPGKLDSLRSLPGVTKIEVLK